MTTISFIAYIEWQREKTTVVQVTFAAVRVLPSNMYVMKVRIEIRTGVVAQK